MRRGIIVLFYLGILYVSAGLFSYSVALRNFGLVKPELLPAGGGGGTGVTKLVSIQGRGFSWEREYIVRIQNYNGDILIPAAIIFPSQFVDSSGASSADLSELKPGSSISITTWGNSGYGPPLIMGLELVSDSGVRKTLLDFPTSEKRYIATIKNANTLADQKQTLAFILPILAALLHLAAALYLRKKALTKKT